jgi:hypothetical protein
VSPYAPFLTLSGKVAAAPEQRSQFADCLTQDGSPTLWQHGRRAAEEPMVLATAAYHHGLSASESSSRCAELRRTLGHAPSVAGQR